MIINNKPQAWQQKQLLGFSVGNGAELERALRLGVNLIEIKINKFKRCGIEIYHSVNSIFTRNDEILNLILLKIKEEKRRVCVSFHLPAEDMINIKYELGLNIGIMEHHDLILKKFILMEEIYRDTGLGAIITFHPPLISIGGKTVLSENEALKNSKIFIGRLDAIWKDDQHLLLTKKNLGNDNAYENFLRYFRRHRVPIVLEISHLERYTDEELLAFIKNLKKELK